LEEFSSAFKQIDAGTVGVTPYMECTDWYSNKWSECNQSTFDVTDFDIQTQNYTMSPPMKEINKVMMRLVLSNDGLEVVIDLTVLYRVSAVDAPTILKK
jgi:hypothetical protein